MAKLVGGCPGGGGPNTFGPSNTAFFATDIFNNYNFPNRNGLDGIAMLGAHGFNRGLLEEVGGHKKRSILAFAPASMDQRRRFGSVLDLRHYNI